MSRVAILGLGLMGGSLGLALREGRGKGVAGYARRAATREAATRLRAVDEVYASAADAARGADVVVACVPILQTEPLLREALPGIGRGCLVTDVGSTKVELNRVLGPLAASAGADFVGSHPICGSDEQGIEAARADLYRGAVVVVTPPTGAEGSPVADRAMSLWESVGARVVTMPAAVHDEILARTSHLPHLVSSLLAATVGREPVPGGLADLCGPGFRDTTRLARGATAVWSDILSTNRETVLRELEAYRDQLNRLIRVLEKNKVAEWGGILEQAKSARERVDDAMSSNT